MDGTAAEQHPALTVEMVTTSELEVEENVRRRNDPGLDEELAQSIATHGMLQPIVARRQDGGLTVVCGHRRLRAARFLELAEVPVSVVAGLEAEQAASVQLAENIHRSRLDPFDEADAVARLVARLESQAKAAERLSKPAEWVLSRMNLLRVSDETRSLVRARKLPLSAALRAAQLQDGDDRERVERELGESAKFGRVSPEIVHRAFDRVQRRLDRAPFDTEDPTLNPDMGSCRTCPFRTGNQRALFADEEEPDVCLDGACWQVKLDATWSRALAENPEARVITDPKDIDKSRWDLSAGLVAQDGRTRDAKGRTYGALFPKLAPVALGRRPDGSTVVFLAADDVAEAAAKRRFGWAEDFAAEVVRVRGHDRKKAGKGKAKLTRIPKPEVPPITTDELAAALVREIGTVTKPVPAKPAARALLLDVLAPAIGPAAVERFEKTFLGKRTLQKASDKMTLDGLVFSCLRLHLFEEYTVTREQLAAIARVHGLDINRIEARANEAKRGKGGDDVKDQEGGGGRSTTKGRGRGKGSRKRG